MEIAAAAAPEMVAAALEMNDGAGETNGRRWAAAAELSVRRRRRRQGNCSDPERLWLI